MTATPGPAGSGLDRALSPYTGWTRTTWLALGDTLLGGVRPYASPGHARITLPGPAGGHGGDVDGLEGFARTFLLAGFRLAGEGGADPGHLAAWYAEGIAAGTDPHAADRWVRLDEHPQAKVEAASIALVLDLTRPWIWDRLAPGVQERVVDYLAPAVGDPTYPRTNWLWFRLVVQTFLRSVGGPWSADDVAEDLATHDSLARPDGWISDGAERSYDHYVGWALHLYPTLWARMSGAADLRGAAARRADVLALDRYLADAVHLVGGDGAPLLQGRSLVYRFAAAAPFWAGALAAVPSVSPGLLRRAASGVARHFVDAGAPDGRGILTLGWHGSWPGLAQSYSGPGSPYWASKGLLGLALPADHPVWTATEEPLPVETGDTLRAVRAPGWLVAGTRADGVVRVLNHGTDHAAEGSSGGDSPLYARLGYSTATGPLLGEGDWTDPLDGSVALVDPAGRASHRSGFRTLAARVEGTAGVAASRVEAHLLTPDREQLHHGSGFVGTPTPAGALTVVSLVRGPWEVRLVRVEGLAADGMRLRVGGWAVAGPPAEVVATGADDAAAPAVARVTAVGTTSALATVCGDPARAGVTRRRGASPLGDPAHVPWVEVPARPGAVLGVLVTLSRAPDVETAAVDVGLHDSPDGAVVRVGWPDGVASSVLLGRDRAAGPSGEHPRLPAARTARAARPAPGATPA